MMESQMGQEMEEDAMPRLAMMLEERQGRGGKKEEMSRLAALEMKEKNEKESKRKRGWPRPTR